VAVKEMEAEMNALKEQMAALRQQQVRAIFWASSTHSCRFPAPMHLPDKVDVMRFGATVYFYALIAACEMWRGFVAFCSGLIGLVTDMSQDPVVELDQSVEADQAEALDASVEQLS
jgi:hypothetical protein